MSSCPSFAVNGGVHLAALVALVLLAGCGSEDGSSELAAGRAAYAAEDFKKAEALFVESAEKNPTNVDTQVSLALVNLRLGDLPEAAGYSANAEALAGGDLDVRLVAAQIAWHQKDNDKALKLYRSLAEDTTLEPSVQSRGWTGLGIVQMTSDAYDLARVSFLTAIRLDRRNAVARYHLGHLYRYAPFAYPEAALEQFQAFVHLHPEADARVQKTQSAIIPALKSAIAQATSDIPGASKRNSAASATALSRAEKLLKKGSYKAAANAYQEALTADPLAYPAALGLARTLVKSAEGKDAQGDAATRALAAYRRACALRPGAVSTLNEAGALAERLKQFATAREIYSRAVAANPASVEALDGLVRMFRRSGDQKTGVAYYVYRNRIAGKSGK